MTPATYHFPNLVRGDSLLATEIVRITSEDEPVALSSARLQVRHAITGRLIHEWTTTGATANATLTGDDSNAVTLGAVAPAVTATWPPSTPGKPHLYDLQVTLAAGRVLTLIAGQFPISADITRDAR